MNPLSVTFIQTSLQWENKEANLRSFEEKISALKGKTQIVFLPEMFSTGFSLRPTQLAEDMGGPTVIWMKSIWIWMKQSNQHCAINKKERP